MNILLLSEYFTAGDFAFFVCRQFIKSVGLNCFFY